MKKDTICAVSTPQGVSGIGIIRISGPDTYRILKKIFKPSRKKDMGMAPSHTVSYGHICDEKGKTLDEVLVTVMRKPTSYTKEDMAEIGCHGGVVSIKSVMAVCIRNGARPADPGEFTRRAFLNGRIDLVQAESVLEIIHSPAEKAMQISLNKLKGSLNRNINSIRSSLLSILSSLEAQINFPEEEDTSKIANIKKQINVVREQVEKLLNRAGKGKVVYRGVNAAIIGRANAGKSSLLNALLQESRAIVTEIAGTTRDSIEETLIIKGIPVKIIDTAGIRRAKNKIEKLGLEKSLDWAEKAQINLLLIDGTKKINEYDRQLFDKIKSKPFIIIINKTDKPLKTDFFQYIKTEKLNSENIIKISALTGKGIEELEERLYALINEGMAITGKDEIFLNLRQEGKIKNINIILADTECVSENNPEIAAEQVKSCIKEIDELTGRNVNEDVLEEIFSRFCIGK